MLKVQNIKTSEASNEDIFFEDTQCPSHLINFELELKEKINQLQQLSIHGVELLEEHGAVNEDCFIDEVSVLQSTLYLNAKIAFDNLYLYLCYRHNMQENNIKVKKEQYSKLKVD